MRSGSTHYQFGTTPFVSPKITFEHDFSEPPRLSAVVKTWTIQGKLYGASETAVTTAWTSLVTAVSSQSSYPDGIRLIKVTSSTESIIERIDQAGGYDSFKVESLEAGEKSIDQWRVEMQFQMVISGKLRLLTTLSGGYGSGASVSQLDISDSLVYDDTGLLTRTLTATVETKAGSSAQTAAELFQLTLPSSKYGYMTKGANNVNVTILDRNDTKAQAICIIRENGLVLPTNVSPSYNLTVQETKTGTDKVTVTTVSARGIGAEAAVRAKRPPGVFNESVMVNDTDRSATAVYVQREDWGGIETIRRASYSILGGGKDIDRVVIGKKVIRHVLPMTPPILTENITVEIRGNAALAVEQFMFPSALNLPEAASQMVILWPDRVEVGLQGTSSDLWQASLTRVYKPDSLHDIQSALGTWSYGRRKQEVTLISEMNRVWNSVK